MTIVKSMLSSIVVAMIGVHILQDWGLFKMSIRPTILGPLILGGLLFGVGWGLLGYCPGTSMGALGEGRWDAAWGILGMLVGARLFAESYPLLTATLYTWGDYGRITVPQLLGVGHWVVIPIFTVAVLFLFRWLEKKRL